MIKESEPEKFILGLEMDLKSLLTHVINSVKKAFLFINF